MMTRRLLVALVVPLAALVGMAAQGNGRKKDRPPTVAITSPVSGTVYTIGQIVTVTAAAADDRGVVRVEFFDGTESAAVETTAPYTWEWAVGTLFNGVHTWTARATDTAGHVTTSAAVTLTVNIATGAPPPPTLPPSSAVGPKPGVICPIGASDVWPDTDLQALINAHVGATTFCIRSGIHPLLNSVTPRSGNTFLGEYGAVFDGAGWATGDTTKGAFRSWNQDLDDVTIRNLVIRHVPMGGVTAFRDFSDRWTVEDVEIGPCGGTGINLPHTSALRRSYVHDCVIGGYAAYLSNDTIWEDNEFARNGNESKIALTSGTVMLRNFVHHSVNGLWLDGENLNWRLDSNRVEDNAGNGIAIEVSGGGVALNNQVRRSGENALLASLSHDVQFVGNLLDGNAHGIVYFVDCSRVGSPEGSYQYPGHIAVPFAMGTIGSSDNTITVGTQPGAFATGFSYTSCTQAELDAYLNGSMGLTFTHNTYTVPSISGSYWLWNGMKPWAQWQAIPQDTTGTVR